MVVLLKTTTACNRGVGSSVCLSSFKLVVGITLKAVVTVACSTMYSSSGSTYCLSCIHYNNNMMIIASVTGKHLSLIPVIGDSFPYPIYEGKGRSSIHVHSKWFLGYMYTGCGMSCA